MNSSEIELHLRLGDKLSVPGRAATHYMIFAGWNANGVALVLHNAKGECVQYGGLHEVCGAEQVTIRRRAQPGKGHDVVARALTYFGQPYRLLNFNCEHFAAAAHGEPIESKQVQGAVGMAVVLGIIIALRDKSTFDGNVGRYRRANGQFA